MNEKYPQWNIKQIDTPMCEKKGAKMPAGISGNSLRKSDEDKPITFEARDPMYDMEDLVLPAHALVQLQTLKSRFELHTLVYENWGLSKTDPCGKHIAFNLYGPPGTGKTMCVEAIAKKLGKKIIDVSYAEIESKYVGDTGKNIVAAFAAAVKQDAILFFDEADSILGQRMTSVTAASDQAVNVSRAVMLKQLDAFDGIVAFATNLAKNFDNAFVRRIPIHIEIPLPDVDGRLRIAQKHVPAQVPFRDKIDFKLFADETDGMSGGDIKNVIVNAICKIASGRWEQMGAVEINEEFKAQAMATKNAKKNVGREVAI